VIKLVADALFHQGGFKSKINHEGHEDHEGKTAIRLLVVFGSLRGLRVLRG
jgi:hypothetical protein